MNAYGVDVSRKGIGDTDKGENDTIRVYSRDADIFEEDSSEGWTRVQNRRSERKQQRDMEINELNPEDVKRKD